MKYNKWTLGLAAVGAVSLASVAQADEKQGTVMNAVSSTVLSGYVDTSAQWNMGSDQTHAPGYKYGGPSKADGFNLDVVKLTLEKALDETDWAAGYKVDLLFGPDANVFGSSSPVTVGNNTKVGTVQDFAIKQAYVALRAPVGNGIDFKVGVFDSVVGYESTEADKDPNFTRSWAHTFEPSTHTGVLGTYQLTKMIGFSFGIADTFGPQINQETAPVKSDSYKTYLGSISLTAPDSMGFLAGSSVYAGVVSGLNGNALKTATTADQTSLYAGVTLATPITALRLGAAYDYAAVGHQTLTANNGGLLPLSGSFVQNGYFNAVSGYATYQLTEKASLHGRLEYATLSSQIATYLDENGTAIASKDLSLTTTLQYDLWKNVISRLELRWDHAADGHDAFGQGVAGGTGTLKNSFILAANVIYKF